MKTPTKRATRRLAASIAIITTLATTGAWAADVKWTGAENNNWGNTNNWRDKASDRPLPTNDNMIVDGQYYHARFTENEIVFDGAYVNGWRTLIHNVGTAEAPLVFRATAPENGLQFGNNNRWNNEFGYNTGDVYLRLENGTWSTGSSEKGTLLGGSSTSCYLTLTNGASFSAGNTLTLQNGELNLTDGSTFSVGGALTITNGELNLTDGSTFSVGGALTITNGELNLTDGSTFSVGGALTITNGVLNLTDGSTFSTASGQSIYLYNDASKMTISGGSTLTGGRYFCLRAGEVTVENATLQNTANNFELGQNATVTLTLNAGGVLEVRQITNKTNGGTVMFNGGEIKAASNALISDSNVIIVKVGTLGGAVNANSHNVTFDRPIAADGENDGGMTFKGGGSVSLKYANTYTGATKVELGTKIIATTADAKASVLGNLVITGVAADGDYYVFEYSGLTDEDVAGATISHGGAAGTTVTRDGNQIKVHYVAPAVDLGWNGGNAAWATANAWTNATGTAKTWSDGNYAVFATGDTVTLGADVAAVSVTFNADATIAAGDGTLTVPVVDVGSGVLATIAAPTAGALEKTGAGTLTLAASRTDTTTLSEGMLVMSGDGTTLDWSTFTFGTDVSKPATLKFENDATVANASAMSFGESGKTTTVYKECGDWNISGNFLLGRSGGLAPTFYHNGGKLTVGGFLSVGDGGSGVSCMEINGGTVNTTHSGTRTAIGSQSDGTAVVRNGGTLNATGDLLVGSTAAGTLTIDDGGVVNVADVIFSYYAEGRDSLVELKTGGELSVNRIYYRNGTSAIDTLRFNGGTIKPKGATLVSAHDGLFVKVAANGGIIDLNGMTVAIEEPLLEDEESTGGGMTFKGGGKATLAEGNTYTGVTTVEVGTTLVVPAAIAGDKLAFTVPGEIADGVYTVVSISGDSQFADDVLSGKAEGFVLSGDKKKICYVQGMDTAKPIYIGTDGNMSAAGNWLDGTVPTGGTGDAQIFCTAASTLTVGDTFAPATITIPSSSALVTIGAGTLCVGEVVNRQLLVVGAGATVVIGDQLTLAKGESLCDQNNGTLVVSNLLLKAENGDRYVTENQTASSSGIFKFDTVTNSMTGNWLYLADHNSAVTNVFYIGAGGLNFLNASGAAGYCLGRNVSGNNSTTIRPWYSDFTIADSGTENNSLILMRNVTFCTDDENGVGRTITIEATTNPWSSSVITVSGTGKLQVNGTSDNSAKPPVTVTDTATLAFGAGASLGTGAITLGAGTTLVLTQPSGSNEFTPLDNTLNLPTEGTATIRIDGARLKSGDHEIATVESGTTANVDLDLTGTALGGRKASLRVEDGNLVLNIQPDGLMVIFR